MASGDAQPILVSEGYRFYVSDLHSLSIAIQVQFFVDGRATIRVATLKWNGKSFAVVEQRYDFLSQSEIADIKRMIDNSRYWDTWSAVKADHAVEPAYMCADQPTSDVEGYRPPAHLLVETHCDDDPVFSKFAKSLTELGRVRLSKGR
jgi:hypothetical protein